jgi:hypothetical protein
MNNIKKNIYIEEVDILDRNLFEKILENDYSIEVMEPTEIQIKKRQSGNIQVHINGYKFNNKEFEI